MVAEDAKAGSRRILVVDDDPGMREMVLHVLRKRGWQAEGAADGLQALARLQHAAYDVVITDLQMPHLDGVALLREIRRREGAPPVIIQTSFLDPSLEPLLRRAGAFRVLMKGGPISNLVQSVEEAYRVSKRPSARCA